MVLLLRSCCGAAAVACCLLAMCTQQQFENPIEFQNKNSRQSHAPTHCSTILSEMNKVEIWHGSRMVEFSYNVNDTAS
jgi:hypothetical protein